MTTDSIYHGTTVEDPTLLVLIDGTTALCTPRAMPDPDRARSVG